MSNLQLLSDEEVEKRKAAEFGRQLRDAFEKTGFDARHISLHNIGYVHPADSRQMDWSRRLAMLIEKARVPGAIIALIGKRGTGKTQMACACAYEISKARIMLGEGVSCMYSRTMDFFMRVKDSYSSDSSEASSFASFLYPRLLVLDEVQVRNESRWEDNCLTYLLDRRYGACKSTILISNQQADEFARSVGDSIMDRLGETGLIIMCNWPSFRGSQLLP